MVTIIRITKQQEPRLLSGLSMDENMINAYKQGKDLYATIASKIYHNDYWDNMEHKEDGTPSPEGKKRRGSVKSLMLGILYGMGSGSLAVSIGCTVKEAQKIIDDFYKEFPKVKSWIDKTYSDAKDNGYVEDFWGRRRRLPDIQLPMYEISVKGEKSNNLDFNPILGCFGAVKKSENPKVVKYKKLLKDCDTLQKLNKVVSTADKDGIIIRSNSGFISRAERQCVNARVQGSAATMSKKAMIKVHSDEILNELGFRLMLAVHDELIGECPIENAEKVADRLCEIMKGAAQPDCVTPFKCDATIESVWYETDYSNMVREDFSKLCNSVGKDVALKTIYDKYCECTEERLNSYLENS